MDIECWPSTLNQVNLIDIFRTLHPSTEYILLSHVLELNKMEPKASIKLKMLTSYKYVLYAYTMEWEINKNKISEKFSNTNTIGCHWFLKKFAMELNKKRDFFYEVLL